MFPVKTMLVDRTILGRDLHFVDHDGRRYNLDDFKTLIDRWKLFLQGRIAPGCRVAVYADNTILTYALAFALWERGICFYGDNFKHRLIERALYKVQVDAIFVDGGNFAEAAADVNGRIPLLKIPSIEDFSSWPTTGSFEEIHLRPQDEILIGFTSGTVGESKVVYHSHASLLAPSTYMAQHHYRAGDSVLIYLNLNHLGYISCILLAAFRAGAEIHVVHKPDPASIFRKLNEGVTNVVPLFSYNWFQMAQTYPEISLANVDRVITGGDFVSQEFARSILGKGARKILNVYGLTEALPPVAIKEITADNLKNYSGENLGSVAPYDQVRFEEGEILVKGENQGRIDPPDIVTSDGYTRTGDNGRLQGEELFMTERKKYFLQIGAREVSISDLKFLIRSIPFQGRTLMDYAVNDGFDMQIINDLLVFVMAAKDPVALREITLDFINEHLARLLDPEVRVQYLLIEKDLPFNGIKLDRVAIRDRILREMGGGAVSTDPRVG